MFNDADARQNCQLIQLIQASTFLADDSKKIPKRRLRVPWGDE
jgi:hypothetical protein